MHFEHLVQINDPANPLLPLLSTEQLWQGLMWRAEDARPFVPGMTGCTILQRSPGALRRRLEFPGATLEDRVTWEAGRWVRFEVEAAASHAGGSLTIGIEEPEPGHLFLRFTYRTTLGEAAGDPDAPYADYVRSAYHAADLDTVRVIRTLLAEGPAH